MSRAIEPRQRPEDVAEHHAERHERHLRFVGQRQPRAQYRRPLLGEAEQLVVPALQLVKDEELIEIARADPAPGERQQDCINDGNAEDEGPQIALREPRAVAPGWGRRRGAS